MAVPPRSLSKVPLAPRTTLGLGGAAKSLVEVERTDDLAGALRECRSLGLPFFVLGGGSNVVVADEGYGGVLLAMRTRGLDVVQDDDFAHVSVEAGYAWDTLVALAADEGWAGAECLAGIPGSVGATPIQNVGAYGQEVSSLIERVDVLDVASLEVRSLSNAECGFSYRDSVFKRTPGKSIVTRVHFRFRKVPPDAPRYAELVRALASHKAAPTANEIRDVVIALRRAKGMVVDVSDPESRSAGSFFLNPIVGVDEADRVEALARSLGVLSEGESMPRFPFGDRLKLAAAWLIERAGITKGFSLGGRVRISRKHTLALVAEDGATTRELLALADYVRSRVDETFGVTLEREPVLLA